MGGLVRQVLAAFFLGLFLVLLGVAGLHLGEGEVREHTHDSAARAEVDACLLDEAVVVVLLGYGTLRADADLHGAEVAQTDDFATAQGVDDDILQCYQHGEHVALVYGTSLLDAFGHFTEVDVAIGLYVAIILRSCFLVARVDARRYGIS